MLNQGLLAVGNGHAAWGFSVVCAGAAGAFAAFLAAGFFAAFFAAGFLAAGFLAAAFFATFLAAGFLALAFLAVRVILFLS